MQHTVKKPQKPKEQEAKNNKSQKSQEAKKLTKQKPQKPEKTQKPRSQTGKQKTRCKLSIIRQSDICFGIIPYNTHQLSLTNHPFCDLIVRSL
jgi:hypothetical protein